MPLDVHYTVVGLALAETREDTTYFDGLSFSQIHRLAELLGPMEERGKMMDELLESLETLQ